jgi:hypothetical protein
VTEFNAHRQWVTSSKPEQEGEKMDLEALFAEIQTILKVNGLRAYTPHAEVTHTHTHIHTHTHTHTHKHTHTPRSPPRRSMSALTLLCRHSALTVQLQFE